MIQSAIEFDRLSDKDLILTPNRRLSAWLVRDFEQWMLQQGRRAWRSPSALPLETWLQDLYSLQAINPKVGPFPSLLSPHQCRVLWHTIIEGEEPVGADIEGLVQLCLQARLLIKRWMLPNEAWQLSDTVENDFFCKCYQRFESQLASQNWIDQAGILEYLICQVEIEADQFDTVFLHGFNDLTEPALQRLKEWLEQSGASVGFSNQHEILGSQQTIAHSKYTDQFRQALFWAAEHWMNNPRDRIGIVVPNLQSHKLKIQHDCEDISAANLEIFSGDWQDLINITAGEPLSQYPIVSHLLLLMSGLGGGLILAEWSVLLKSPYFILGNAESENLSVLGRFELFDRFVDSLQQRNRNHYDIARLEECWQLFLKKEGRLFQGVPPDLFWCADSAKELLPSAKKRELGEWLHWLDRVIAATGWGQQRVLDSLEYQVLNRFREMQRGIRELEPFLTSLTYSAFVREFSQQTKSIVFQPQTETAPIQVMGALEAAGLNFDALWVCGCESVNWPQTTQPNPLIPRKTLIKYHMPGSGPERELVYAETMMKGFRTAAGKVVFSWARFEGEVEHSLTPLLTDLDPGEYQCTKLVTSSRLERQRHRLQYIKRYPADEQGTAVVDARAKGGSALLKAQSLCPFKSFAEYRLGIKSADEIDESVKASDRGNLVHKVLEQFWTSINGSSELKALLSNEALLDKHLAMLIDEEMDNFKDQVYLNPDALYALERARTFSTIKNWLSTAEQARLPFVIDRVEKKQTISIAGLELNLTVDRIDQLEDGRKIIIDYKTGSVTTSSWLGERPEEPQLPLYTLLDSNNNKGIYFAIVKPDKSEWQGLGEEGLPFLSTKSRTVKTPEQGWERQLEQWKGRLEALAKEFVEGHASVSPLKETTCQYCHLSPVCRVKELTRADS